MVNNLANMVFSWTFHKEIESFLMGFSQNGKSEGCSDNLT